MRLNELKNLIKEMDKNAILVFNDTRLKEDKDIKSSGYHFLTSNKSGNTSTAGGSAIGVPSAWRLSDIKCGPENVLALICDPKGRMLKVLTCYNRPGRSVDREVFQKFHDLKYKDEDIEGYITGDFNCPHTLLGSSYTNNQGRELLSIVNEFDLHTIHRKEPTFVDKIHGSVNTLDFCFANRKGFEKVHKWEVLQDVGSDHLPTQLTLQNLIPKRVDYVDAYDYEVFKSNLEAFQNFPEIPLNPNGIDEAIESFTHLVTESFESSKYRKRRRLRGNVILSKKTCRAIKERRKLAKLLTKSSVPLLQRNTLKYDFNKQCRRVKRLIKKDERKALSITISKIQTEKNSSKKWDLINVVLNNDKKEPKKYFLHNADGQLEGDAEKIVNIHADRLEQVFNPDPCPSFDEHFKQATEQFIQDNADIFKPLEPELLPRGEEGDELFNRIRPTGEKIKALCQKLKYKSAPGHDKVTNRMLKNMSSNFNNRLAEMYKACLKVGYFSRHWKMAIVRMLLKKGKCSKDSKSYRPVSLLSVLGKILELLIKEALDEILKEIGFKNPIQSGFKPGRCCQENFLRLIEDSFTAFNNQECVVACMLDVEGAFDKLWRDGLRKKLFDLGLPIKMVRILSSFLDERTLYISENGCYSRIIDMETGSPQGAILSPILFAIYVSDLPLQCNPKVSASQYADDANIWCRSKCPRLAQYELQRTLDEINKWCSKWRTKLAASKSQVIVLTQCPTLNELPPRLTLDGVIIPVEKEVTFLGCKLDKKLNFTPLVDELIKKSQYRIWMIKKVAKGVTNGNFKIVFDLFDSFVTSLFAYSAPAFITTPQYNWDKIEQMHAKAIKTFLHLPNRISYGRALDASAQIPLRATLEERAFRRIKDIAKKSPMLPETLLSTRNDNPNPTYTSPIHKLLKHFQADLTRSCILCLFKIPHACVKR
jgi:hypothetical protein